ncbi:biosynthetic peptidoglycan transglycosylase [Myxococcus faecalis]|uniref:biosynthetic peptidoglycan transglycosylase n=1 Tax=Myxococcus faecalis TaxID=3115646 RepID=UPI003CE7A9ED
MRRWLLPGLLLMGAVYPLWLGWLTPDVSALVSWTPPRTRFMLLRAEELGVPEDTYVVRQTPLERLSPLLVCAVVKAEDRGFFQHAGVEWKTLGRAARAWLGGDARHGGSTLTQQLARNLYLSPERTVHRKLREVWLSRALEAALSKRRLLELYLSTVEWGEGVWGAEAASLHYFGKPPDTLDAFEASFLSSLLAAPRRALTGNNAQRALTAQTRVLSQLLASGLVSPREQTHALMRMDLLHAGLARGESFHTALGGAHVPAVDVEAFSATLPSMDEVLRDACGRARELAKAAAASEVLGREH